MNFFKNSKKDSDFLDINNDQELLKPQKQSLLSRIFKNEEGQFYSDIITKGFIWVIMFFVSLVALILVFKDNYSSNKEIVVLNNQNSNNYMSSYTGANNTGKDYSFNNAGEEPKITSDNDQKAENKPKEDNKIAEASSNPQAKASALKQNALPKSQASTPPNSANSSINNSSISNLITNNIKNNKSSFAPIKPKNKENYAVQPPAFATKNNETVWLVSVYSSGNYTLAKQKWDKLQENNPGLFINKKAYFIKLNIEGKGVYYRVSLGDANADDSYPSFKSAGEAAKYCKYLKNQKVDCFIMSTSKSEIVDLIHSPN